MICNHDLFRGRTAKLQIKRHKLTNWQRSWMLRFVKLVESGRRAVKSGKLKVWGWEGGRCNIICMIKRGSQRRGLRSGSFLVFY